MSKFEVRFFRSEDAASSSWLVTEVLSDDGEGNRTSDIYAEFDPTPAGLEKWLGVNHSALWPSTYADLRDLGLGLSICEWLEFEVGRDRSEQLVVATFLNFVREFRFAADGTSTRTVPAVKGAMSIVKVEKPETELESEIRLAMVGVGQQTWPVAVINFPEACC
jgi:hypothetical protein